MPVLDVLNKDGALRWDALGTILGTIYFPREADLRQEYAARWRAEHKSLLPAGNRLWEKTTHGPAKAFGRRNAIAALERQRRQQIERVGTASWLQAFLSKIDPSNASETKSGYLLAEFGKRAGIEVSRSTVKRDWARYRGVIHWCAAISYQRRIFGAPLLCHPDIGPPDYSNLAALFDFLKLAHQFFAFARDSGCFAATPSFKPERDVWTLPAGGLVAPVREPAWPDCDRIRATVRPDPVVCELLKDYDATQYSTH